MQSRLYRADVEEQITLLIVGNHIGDSDLSVHLRGESRVVTFAANVSVRDVLAK